MPPRSTRESLSRAMVFTHGISSADRYDHMHGQPPAYHDILQRKRTRNNTQTHKHTHTHRGDSGKTRHLLILMQCTVGCRTVGCQMLYCGVIMGPVWPTRPADKRTACGHDMCPEQTQKCPDQHTWCVLADILSTPKEPWARSS